MSTEVKTSPRMGNLHRRYLTGAACLLILAGLLVWALWPWKLTLTFLEDGQPVAGLKMDVVIADDNVLDRKTLITDEGGQITIPRPNTDGDATVRLWFPDGMRVNTILPVRNVAWTSFDYSSTFEQDGQVTTKYPGRTVTQRNAPVPKSNSQTGQ
ncbi:hypothetical protein FYZ48_27140 [Gimesia chilikensis]|uniref:hypothetical protein n=1 Tax=Gimesia chilikensis TaxID=2605989 RepID=UPI0011ED182C|nr:hypothetical protein [Gimesia chilikensis]KAA0131807.1 hypothetical protein FYZ48_27140 [Gimesia chilikensis]